MQVADPEAVPRPGSRRLGPPRRQARDHLIFAAEAEVAGVRGHVIKPASTGRNLVVDVAAEQFGAERSMPICRE